MRFPLALGASLLACAPLAAQPPQPGSEREIADTAYEGTVFDGDWITLGAGAVYGPSYSGSDDYVVSPIPVIQGNLAGIGITPRPAGLALDFLPKREGKPSPILGIAARLNRNRATQIEDRVVHDYGKLGTGVEVGPTVGMRFPAVLNPYDSLSVTADIAWDVAGASKGMTVSPSVTYFTPVSRGAAVSLTVSATHMNDRYARYYYSVPVTPASVAPGDALPVYDAGGGFEKLGGALFGIVDLDGNLANGGLSLIVLGGYSRLLGDAAGTPFTAIRGSADQWVGAVGVGYTF